MQPFIFVSFRRDTSYLLKHIRSCEKKDLNPSIFNVSTTCWQRLKKNAQNYVLRTWEPPKRNTRIHRVNTGVIHGQCDVSLLPSGVTCISLHKQKVWRPRAALLPTVKKAITYRLACCATTDMWTDCHRNISCEEDCHQSVEIIIDWLNSWVISAWPQGRSINWCLAVTRLLTCRQLSPTGH